MNKAIIPGAALRQLEKNRAYFRKYRAEHPELKQYYSAYYRANKEKWQQRRRSDKSRAYMKAYRLKNRARLSAQLKAWSARNPERVREITKRHRLARRPQKRLADKRYRQEKPEAYKASVARAKASKPDLYRTIAVKGAMKRRARMKSAICEPVSLVRIADRDRGCCHLCRRQVERADRSFDHLIPILRGGAHAEWNLLLAHDRCNKRRGTKQILATETKEAAQAYIAARCAETIVCP